MVVDRQTDRQIDRKKHRQTDKVSYRGASHLKSNAIQTFQTALFFIRHPVQKLFKF